jgi:O-antigen ligase
LGWIALYTLSYFWSADKGEWNAHLQVKLPFLLLPLSFALLPPFTGKELRIYTWGLAAIMTTGALFSLSFLWRGDAADIIEGYKYAHVLRTPVYNDHIAFSTALALSIAWIVFCLPSIPRRWERVVLTVLCVLLAAYLHILAAKTGLVALYIFILGFIIYQGRRSLKKGFLLLALAACLFALAYISLPTLRERIGYSFVTWRSYRMGERNSSYSDAGRIFSYHISLRSIAVHPLDGVGAGDVLHEMRDGYAQWYPQVPEEQQLWPHNQWLTCAMAAGIPAALLFTLWLIAPLRRIRRNRQGAFFLIVWAMLLVPLMVDPFLEVQFGVAVFLIFLLMQKKQLDGIR